MIKTGVEVCGLRNVSDLQALEDRGIALEAEKIVALVATLLVRGRTTLLDARSYQTHDHVPRSFQTETRASFFAT